MNGRMSVRLLKNKADSIRRAAACVAALLLVAAAVWTAPQAASSTPQNMLGVWHGYFQPQGVPVPEDGIPVRTEVTSQENRRINGLMEVGGIDPQPFMFNGTVAASDRVNLQGQHEERHGIAKLDLHDFGGGAAVLNGSLALLAAGGRVSDGSLLLLRPFAFPPEPVVPNPAGSYAGSFFNVEGTRGAGITAQLHPPEPVAPSSFTGQIVVVAGEVRHVFELKGTINAAGRLVAIAQASAGHLVLDATWAIPPDGSMPTMITGRHILELNDGTVHEGTFSMTLESPR